MVDNERSNNHTMLIGGERLVTIIFYLLGIGVLLPWNAFISAKPYFESRLCDPDDPSPTDEGGDVESWFGLVFNLASVCSLGSIIVVKWYRDRRPSNSNNNFSELQSEMISSDVIAPEGGEPEAPLMDEHTRTSSSSSSSSSSHDGFWMVIVPLTVYLVVFLLTTIVVLIPHLAPNRFLSFTLILLALCGVSCSVAGAGIIATAGAFDPRIGISPYFSGQAIGGVAVSLSNFIAQTLHDPTNYWAEECPNLVDSRFLEDKRNTENIQQQQQQQCTPYMSADWNTFAYFCLGCFVLALCIIGYVYIQHSNAAERLRQQGHSPLQTNADDGDNIPMDEQEGNNIEIFSDDLSPPQQTYQSGSTSREVFEVSGPEDDRPAVVEEIVDTVSVYKAVSGPVWSIWLTLFVTLTIFPTWTSRLESVHKCQNHSRLQNDLYVALTFVIFNVGDLTGRLLSDRVNIDAIADLSKKLVLLSLARLMFGPIFYLCSARDSAFEEVIIKSDIFSMLLQYSFALTNGMLLSLSFMHAPSLIPSNASVQGTASTIMNFSLVLGLLCGSFFSFGYALVGTGRITS